MFFLSPDQRPRRAQPNSGGDQPTYDGTWSRWGFDDARTGLSPASGPVGDLTVAWRIDVFEGYPTGSPVVSDETVYYLHTRGGYDRRHESVVSAFAADTGAELWRTTVSETDTDELGYHHDSLVVADGRLYARTFEGLHAMTTAGELLWTHPVPTTEQPYPRIAPPIVSNGMAVTATYGERTPPVAVVAVDAETGRPRWRAGFNSRRMPWTLSAADGTVYVPFLDGDSGLVALDIGTGKREWSHSLPVDGPVTVAGDTILAPLGGDPESIAAIDRQTRDIVWREPVRRRVETGIAVAGELVYYCSDGLLVARRLDTGELVWSFGPRPLVSLSWTPVVAGQTVYAVAERPNEEQTPNYLYALDAATGEVRGSGQISVASRPSGLAVVDGAAYLALGRGELLGIESCEVSVLGRCLDQ